MKITKYTADIVTGANLLCGVSSVVLALNGSYVAAGWLIILAAVLDVLDGKVAQVFDITSEFGREFDSLADLISFVLAPVVLVFVAFGAGQIGIIAISLYVLCGAIRLAKFNISTERLPYFIGIPTTAAGSFLASSVLILEKYGWTGSLYWVIAIFALACLMVSKIKYPSLKAVKKIKRSWYPILVAGIILLLIDAKLLLFLAFLSYVIVVPIARKNVFQKS